MNANKKNGFVVSSLDVVTAADKSTICNDAAALAGYIAQQSEILKRTDLTPCRRAHHEKKLASYREMLQHAR